MSNSKKTIFFISNESKLLGATKVLLAIVNYLNSTQQYNIVVICPTEGEFKSALQQNNIITVTPDCFSKYFRHIGQASPVLLRYLYRIWDNLKLFIYFARLFQKNKKIIVYANTSVVRFIAFPAWLTKTKLLWHVHESFNNKLKQKFHSILIRWFADRIVLHSEFIISKMNLSERAQKKVIFFRYYSIIENKVHAQSNSNQIDFDLLFAGKIGFQKGVFDLLKAVAKVVKVRPNLKVGLCGVFVDKDKQTILDFVSEQNLAKHITFNGYVPDLDEYILKSKVIVLPTYRDYFPLLIMEAVTLEKPVISTGVGDIRSIIADNKNGIIISPGNIEQLKDAILTILDENNYDRFLAGAKQHKKDLLFDSINDYEKLENAINQLY
jgi:glycosyltransferase involved in cell wall biosynthesis